MNIIHKLNILLLNYLLREKYISENDLKNYLYCFDYIGELLFFWIVTFFIGLILQNILFPIMFFFIIIPLRSLYGGYHASTRTACTIISFAIFGLTFFIYNVINLLTNHILELAVYIICFILLWSNKSVYTIRKSILNKRAALCHQRHFYLIMISLLFLLMMFINLQNCYKMILACIIMSTFNMFAGTIQHTKKGGSYATEHCHL